MKIDTSQKYLSILIHEHHCIFVYQIYIIIMQLFLSNSILLVDNS